MSADSLIEALLRHWTGGIGADEMEPRMLRELRHELESNQLLGPDLERLWNLLKAGVVRSGFRFPEGDELRLFNLACAHCEEQAVLAAFFAQHGHHVRFFGMDVRDREIERAKRRYELTERVFQRLGVPRVRDQSNKIEFFAGDGAQLAGSTQLPREFEVFFLRHQNVWHDRATWQRIFEFALDRLAGGGIVVITSYFDREHMIALELFRQLGGEVLATERNPQSRELDHPGKSVDRHIAVIGRSG